jgi:hypothetical protein
MHERVKGQTMTLICVQAPNLVNSNGIENPKEF